MGTDQHIEHTFYVGSFEEIVPEVGPDLTSIKKTQVTGNVLHVKTTDPLFNVTEAIEYLHRDHLGSVERITGANGDELQVLAYDPFGARRNSDWIGAISETEFDVLLAEMNVRTSRGFTGHEHLDRTGIIHMNGRIYDPRLGRFLQADPFIQDASFTQSYNRYSYGFNNPLNGTDPSGFSFWRDLIGFLTNGIAELFADKIPFLRPLLQIAHCVWGGPVACGFSAFGNTIAAGGSFKDAMINGISAYAFSSLSLRGPGNFGFNPETVAYVGKMATLGGIVAELQGGKFGHGFLSSGLSAVAGGAIGGNPTIARALGKEGRFIASIIVGGTLSELTGGKFVNGAITAAFAATMSYVKWNMINRSTYGRTIKMDAKTAEEIWQRVKAAGEEMGIDMSPDRVAWINKYALEKGEGRNWGSVTTDSYEEGLYYLGKGYTWLNAFELGGHITIYRGAIAGVFEYINTGSDFTDSWWNESYTRFTAGLFVLGHEDEHTRQNSGMLRKEQRANSFGVQLVQKYCSDYPGNC